MESLQHFSKRFTRILAHRYFWRFILSLFVFQAVWIALSNRYPMAFDEDYHFGLIKLYSHHLWPFWHSQPASADYYGAVFRDPSYLYQYIMSFPYRLLTWLTSSESAQIIGLRLVNIASFTAGLFIFRSLLTRLSGSRAVVNFCLLLFILLPVVPLLAGQVNYDNLFIPLVGMVFWLVTQITEEFQSTKRVNGPKLVLLLTVCLLTSLVKYAFLPIFLALWLYLAWLFVRRFKNGRSFTTNLLFSFTLISKVRRVMLIVALIIASSLFVERYGINIIRYHTPVPDCSQVLSEKRCSAYGPWIRDHILASQKTNTPGNALYYFYHEWIYGMWLRLLFVVDGPITLNETRGPLLLPAIDLACLMLGGILGLVVSARWVWRQKLFRPLLIGSGVYLLALFFDGFEAYHRTGQPVAINGRYLLPVLPVMMLMSAQSWQYLLRRFPSAKAMMAVIVIVASLWGGGLLTFILRTSDYWYWDSSLVRTVNYNVRHTIGPVVPGYESPTEFLR